ncbi:hypothetical protein [Rhizobium sp. Leaf371]|uniref:hypothetical protein n=1 Tax=Rhizobium sp. Leaf371 TaxID=1736355 RepID=UPI000A6EC347|nr:hypothetical protein [Rhizobium sp. Leaf371]
MTADFENISGSRHGSEPEEHTDRNRMVIGLLLISAFVVILNETIMVVALPRLI